MLNLVEEIAVDGEQIRALDEFEELIALVPLKTAYTIIGSWEELEDEPEDEINPYGEDGIEGGGSGNFSNGYLDGQGLDCSESGDTLGGWPWDGSYNRVLEAYTYLAE